MVSWLLGLRRRPATVGGGALVLGVLAILVVTVLSRWVITDETNRTLVWLFNGFAGVVLFLTLFLVVCAGVLYGLWNGGPLLALALPTLPLLVATVLSRQVALTTDVALAVCSGAAATSVGTARSWVSVQARQRATSDETAPGRDGDSVGQALLTGLLVSVAVTTLGIVALWRVVAITGAAASFTTVTAVPLLVVAFFGHAVVLGTVFLPATVFRLIDSVWR